MFRDAPFLPPHWVLYSKIVQLSMGISGYRRSEIRYQISDIRKQTGGRGDVAFEQEGYRVAVRKGYRMVESGTFRLSPVFVGEIASHVGRYPSQPLSPSFPKGRMRTKSPGWTSCITVQKKSWKASPFSLRIFSSRAMRHQCSWLGVRGTPVTHRAERNEQLLRVERLCTYK
jgi:hypothetical protein